MSKEAKSGGIGFTGVLTVVFVTLKLTHYIDWSWWWVFSPVWIPIGLVAVGGIVALILIGGAYTLGAIRK